MRVSGIASDVVIDLRNDFKGADIGTFDLVNLTIRQIEDSMIVFVISIVDSSEA